MARRRRAVIYCRISSDHQGDGLGVARQEAEARTLADRLGVDVELVLVDNDISGYSGKRRPGFEQLIALVERGEADVVLCWAPDRLTRHTRELEDLIDLLERTQTAVHTVVAGEYDLSTPAGRMSARVVGAVARHESELKSKRLRSKMAQKAAAGEPQNGGHRPYGYTADRRHVVPAEAEEIRLAANRVLGGASLRQVAREMTERGTKTARGEVWTGAGVARVLRSPRIAGLLTHKGQVTAEAVWPAIIDQSTHARLVALLDDPQRATKSGQRGRAPRLLTGFIRCGRCGMTMNADTQPGGRSAYRCRRHERRPEACGRVSILAERLDEIVGQVVVEMLDAGALQDVARRRAATGTDAVARAELATIDDERRQLGELFGDAAPTFIRAALDKLEAREQTARSALSAEATADAAAHVPLALIADGVSGATWEDLPVDTKRAVLAVLDLPIVIAPGGDGRGKRVGQAWSGIDESRVSIGPITGHLTCP